MSAQVHTVAELQRVLQLKLDGCMLGINNRDLGTFKVDLHNNKVIMDSPAGQEVCYLASTKLTICDKLNTARGPVSVLLLVCLAC